VHPSEPTHPADSPEPDATTDAGPTGAGSERPDSDPATGGSSGGAAAAATAAAPRKSSFWKELPFLVLIALVLALLIKTFLVQAFYIPSASMELTLGGGPYNGKTHPYDRVLVNKLIYRIRDVHRGEIVVFKGPKSWQEQPEFVSHTPSNPIGRFFHDIGSAIGVAAPSSKDFIKRVIGVGGDTVRCTDDKLYVNNVKLVEPFIYPGSKQCSAGFDGQSVTVPKGRLFVMGDNRDGSADSRYHLNDHSGTVPASDVIGRAFVVVWPPSDWKTLPVPGTFHQKGLAALAATDPLLAGFVGAVPLTLLRRRASRRWRTRRSRRQSVG
jgi:signal peptidase I